ncbi:SRPBCC family protein [Exiguobacterium flavidum]|uniref:SRPBCC family protein n=1 Tax=Exiguobacterium flavidum TaxID=2184695 RepID=UPI000DF73AC7|nr:SRPBCC domain-containing protein [Exiguobacterium flavidum]
MKEMQLNTRTEGAVLILERMFEAPRDLVFEAYSNQDHLERWWGPEGWETDIHQFEFRPGGIWHYCMRCVDETQGEFFGMESWGKAVFRKIDAPTFLAYTDYFSDASGTLSDELPSSEIEIDFEEKDGGTLVIFRSDFKTEEGLRQVLDMGVVEGFSSQLRRLDELLATAN